MKAITALAILGGGAVSAAFAGALTGMAFREPPEAAPAAGFSQAELPTPSAFEAWQPIEGAPPPYMPDDAQNAYLPDPALAQAEAEIAPDLAPAQTAQLDLPPSPEPYSGTAEDGQVVASADVEAPPERQAEAAPALASGDMTIDPR